MSDEIKVHVVDYGPNRKALYMRYTDPVTGKHVTRSTGTRDKDKANKAAGKWEDDLRAGRCRSTTKITWKDFRERYETEIVPGLAVKTGKKIAAVFDKFEELISPATLRVISTAVVSQYAQKLRTAGRAETTIKSHLGHLKAALRWAHEQGMLATVPMFRMPTRTKTARHRPITTEEFERMLQAVPDVVTDTKHVQRSESWKHLLRGLWWSGLRIGEALKLSWDREDLPVIVRQQKRWMLSFPAEHQKNHKNELLPLAPEFAAFLEETPEAERVGFVFNPLPRYADQRRVTEAAAIKTIADIGAKANVKAGTNAEGKGQYATAHDLRRSFGDRWAKRVMPAVLKQLMRHASITTTMQFYVGTDAEQTAAVLDEAFRKATEGSNSSGNTDPNRQDGPANEKTLNQPQD